MVDYMMLCSLKLFIYNRIVLALFGDYIMEDCRSYANEDDLVCDSHYEDMRYDLDWVIKYALIVMELEQREMKNPSALIVMEKV